MGFHGYLIRDATNLDVGVKLFSKDKMLYGIIISDVFT